ncbi:prephenate/arogenate dehydrogenase family protein [Croceicoccus naphthovorans]|uniref:prephenate dehydrogenase n=1 Tax=Croceicoccus naphthovorans TaxID=1348774 RepID=A0A0G3XJY0_9SPHN|nr:prephenate/arogenate dehydrogenase family protein [Croceicoccus naphthovorans]AKM10899.1 cyclohexadienyl dehydrogenase [Croceicoccus naphthovorans]MBB3989139.1 cyclohexadieny/prephenate dehydrogenase [Croceicoccus naphthovorans]
MSEAPFPNVAVIGLGLIGGSIGLAVQEYMPGARVTGWDADADVRCVAGERGLAHAVPEELADAVADADLIVLCVPVRAMESAAAALAGKIKPTCVISDVGSCKQSVAEAIARALPGQPVVPAHPVAGTEHSGPEAGFATLFQNRWCILTPGKDSDPQAVERVSAFWANIGATVDTMAPDHHDLVLAVTSHVPHLIAYTIVGTASDLEEVTRGEVIKYSAGGFRDFTRIASSDPTMWRDVFLSNKQAVLEILQRLSEDLSAMQRAIRRDDGDALFDHFTKTRAIRRSIIEEGQDDARPDFGRSDHSSVGDGAANEGGSGL